MSEQIQPSTLELEKHLNIFQTTLKMGGQKEAENLFDNLAVPSPHVKKRISNQELLKQVKTGDIILWSGSSAVSKIIRFFSNSPFSHASIVFKGALNEKERLIGVSEVPRIFQATWSDFKEEFSGWSYKVSRQVMLNDLEKVLIKNEEESEPATLRAITCKESKLKFISNKLSAFISTTHGDQYPGANKGMPEFWDYLKGLIGIPVNQPDKYFCSELVAGALQSMSILDTKKPINAYSPADFSDKQYDKLKKHINNAFDIKWLSLFYEKLYICYYIHNFYISHSKVLCSQCHHLSPI